MLTCYQKTNSKNAIPVTLINQQHFSGWLKTQKAITKAWLKQNEFKAKPYQHCLLMNRQGSIDRVFIGISNENDMWAIADLPNKLPTQTYYLDSMHSKEYLTQLSIGWGLGAYQFTRYKKAKRKLAKLIIPTSCDPHKIETIVSGVYLARDLINTPADDMGPSELSSAAFDLAKQFNAEFTEIVGKALTDEGYKAIYAVGRGSDDAPRLIDFSWGDAKNPQVTLIGKGVCFDTGGLNLKPSSGMTSMKKDMGGAAHVLALAQMIMSANLPIRLRVLIPAVENVVSGNVFHPGDVITMRNGKTVEVTNTDAEGRLILADVLTEACAEKPDLLIDFSTLTGAARVALGADIAAMFSSDDEVSKAIINAANEVQDPVWQMPLYQPYNDLLKSPIADLNNAASAPYGGAITAALFIQQFIDSKIPWVHFDIMAMNPASRPGRPEGGEANMLRGVFGCLENFCF